MKNLRIYLIGLPSIMLLLVLFLWNQSSQSGEALVLEPIHLSETVTSQEETALDDELENKKPEESQTIYVDLKGAVRYPNVYALPIGSRLFDVIEMAGGLLPEAATQHLNQSLLLSDQLLIYIYSMEEVEASQMTEVNPAELPMVSGPELVEASTNTSGGLININQATVGELMTLPGIGPKKAEAIIQYRSERGSFASPEAIMEVSGIGQKTYEQLASLITVD